MPTINIKGQVYEVYFMEYLKDRTFLQPIKNILHFIATPPLTL